MKTNKGLSALPKTSQKYRETRTSYMRGPLLGLGYIIVLPFAGLAGILVLVGHYVKVGVVAIAHWAVHIAITSKV